MSQPGAEYTDLPIYREQLASALGFDESDLASNRLGQLGRGQRTRLLPRLAVIAASVLFAMLLAVVFGWLGFASAHEGGALPAALIGIAAALVAVGYFGRLLMRFWRDLRAGLVANVEGFVKPVEKEGHIGVAGTLGRVSVWSYVWIVDNGIRFAVRGAAYVALVPSRHRIYYLPQSRVVVAAEPLGRPGT